MTLSQAESAVSLNQLSLWSGREWVLKNLTVEIRSGSFCVLLGANGAGKSSLLKLVAGVLQSPWAREGALCVPQVEQGASRFLGIGWLPQSMPFCEDMSVREFLEVSKGDGAPFDVRSLLRDFELEILLSSRLSTLSGGQWQRVRLAQVLAKPSRILLLDEPDTALDARWRAALWHMLREKHRQGVTIVVSAHRFSEIESFATDWIGLCEGRLVFSVSHQGVCPQAYVDRLFLGKVLDSLNLLG